MAIRLLLVVAVVLSVGSLGYGDDAALPEMKVKRAVSAKKVRVAATAAEAHGLRPVGLSDSFNRQKLPIVCRWSVL